MIWTSCTQVIGGSSPPRKETEMIHPKDRNNTAPMNIERWALPLFKSVGLVPKSCKTVARSQIKCASCEICSYHLGLEFPDLSPPFKDMYICDVCNRTYHWQCLLKTSCCNATEREAIDANDSWACFTCINLNQNEKKSYPLLSGKRGCGGLKEPNLGARRTTKHM